MPSLTRGTGVLIKLHDILYSYNSNIFQLQGFVHVLNPFAQRYCGPFYSKTKYMHQCIKFILFWNDTACFGLSFRPSSGA